VLETGLRAWLAGQIGAAADVAALPLRVIAGEDAYRLEIPFGGPTLNGAVTLGEGAVTARVRQLDDNRWAIEDMRLPSPWTIDIDPALRPAGKDGPTSMTLKIAEQDVHGILDTSLATTSSFDARLAGYSVVMDGKQGPQTTHIGSMTGHMVWQPAGDGRVTMTALSSAENYAASSAMPDGTKLEIGVAHMRTSLTATDVDMAEFGAIVRATAGLAASIRAQAEAGDATKAATTPTGVPEADKAGAKALVRALAGMMGGLTSEMTYDGIKVALGTQTGSLHRLSIGFDMTAPAGKADVAWRIGLDGLESPLIPKGPIRDLMPRHLAMTPHIGGIPKNEVVDLVLRAIDEPNTADSFMTTMTELLAKGPLRLGLEDIALDLGPARLSGGGAVEVAAMDDITGGGEFRATGLDALIHRSNTTPELKQAAPMLIFLKGIGRQEGKATVWKIRYEGHKILVNDTDLSAMIPGQ
jgi:hypothetical protein